MAPMTIGFANNGFYNDWIQCLLDPITIDSDDDLIQWWLPLTMIGSSNDWILWQLAPMTIGSGLTLTTMAPMMIGPDDNWFQQQWLWNDWLWWQWLLWWLDPMLSGSDNDWLWQWWLQWQLAPMMIGLLQWWMMMALMMIGSDDNDSDYNWLALMAIGYADNWLWCSPFNDTADCDSAENGLHCQWPSVDSYLSWKWPSLRIWTCQSFCSADDSCHWWFGSSCFVSAHNIFDGMWHLGA